MFGVISSVGYDAEGFLDAKLHTMFQQYNPSRNHQLQEQGMGFSAGNGNPERLI